MVGVRTPRKDSDEEIDALRKAREAQDKDDLYIHRRVGEVRRGFRLDKRDEKSKAFSNLRELVGHGYYVGYDKYNREFGAFGRYSPSMNMNAMTPKHREAYITRCLSTADTKLKNKDYYEVLQCLRLAKFELEGAAPFYKQSILSNLLSYGFSNEYIPRKQAKKFVDAIQRRVGRLSERVSDEGLKRKINIFEEEMQERYHASPIAIRRTALMVLILNFFGGIFFLSSSVTGNVIGLSNGTSSIIGAVLLVIGFVAGYFWARSRKSMKRK